MKLETITPNDAAVMLRMNSRNRRLRDSVVKRYAEQMAGGLWKITGDTIKIGSDGSLLDGQHRLYACMQAQVCFDAYVVRNLSPEVFDVLDAGMPRHPSDILHIRGELSTNLLAAALGWVFRLEHGSLHHTSQGAKMTSHAALELLGRHPRIREFVTAANGTHALAGVGRNSINASCYYLFALQNEDLARQFMVKLASGIQMERDEPVYLLRERLLKEAGRLSKLPANHIVALYFRAWNATKEGRRMKMLAPWRPEVEKFPDIGPIPSVQSLESQQEPSPGPQGGQNAI